MEGSYRTIFDAIPVPYNEVHSNKHAKAALHNCTRRFELRHRNLVSKENSRAVCTMIRYDSDKTAVSKFKFFCLFHIVVYL